jgi:hypothetical protein
MRTTNILWFSLLLVACNASVNGPATENVPASAKASAVATAADPVPYKRIHATAHSAKRPVGLCELGRFLDGGAGMYKVVSLTGQTEATEAGTHDGFTYVELELVEAWTDDAPEHPVARISGGPAGKGITKGFAIDLAVGEMLGVMLYAPRDENRGFYGMDSLGLFQGPGRSGFTNGQLFLDAPRGLEEIGKLVRGNALAKGGCENDVLPSARRAAPEFPAPSGFATKPVRIVLGKGDAAPQPQ